MTEHPVISLMLVDDAVELRSMLKILLERTGRIVVPEQAGDAATAEAQAGQLHLDAVLVDLAMPGGGALELITRLRETRPGLAIVVLSGYPATGTADRCLQHGADRYLEKGIPVAQLVDELHAAVEGRRR
jgi:DNA-binding NarL/FixJ family response regulator